MILKRKTIVTSPCNGEIFSSQVRENALQFFAQIYEIRRDVSGDAESARFQWRKTFAFLNQIRFVAERGHRRFSSRHCVYVGITKRQISTEKAIAK